MQTTALSLSLISVLHRKTTGEAVCSRDRDNEVFSCKFYRVDSFINIIFFFLSFFIPLRKQGSIVVFLQTYFIEELFFSLGSVHLSSLTCMEPPAFTSVHTPFVCIKCTILRRRLTLWHMPLTVSLFLEPAALVTLRH